MTLGLGQKPTDHYASFRRRTWAITADSVWILILVAPLVDAMFRQAFGEPPVDFLVLQERVAAESDPIGRLHAFWRTLLESGQVSYSLWGIVVQTVTFYGSLAACWFIWSSTPGKMLFRMKIVDAVTEAPMTRKQMLWRFVGYCLATLPLMAGFFPILWDKQRRGWHDRLAGTVVIIRK